jgi:hypothetical protein
MLCEDRYCFGIIDQIAAVDAVLGGSRVRDPRRTRQPPRRGRAGPWAREGGGRKDPQAGARARAHPRTVRFCTRTSSASDTSAVAPKRVEPLALCRQLVVLRSAAAELEVRVRSRTSDAEPPGRSAPSTRFADVSFTGRPPSRLAALATSRPAWARSRISSRSNSPGRRPSTAAGGLPRWSCRSSLATTGRRRVAVRVARSGQPGGGGCVRGGRVATRSACHPRGGS